MRTSPPLAAGMGNLPVIERLSSEDAEVNAAVIWLHGLGADGNDFVPLVPQLRLPAEYAVRFVFPSAASIPVTINDGFVMPAWYDILRLDSARSLDLAGLRASAAKIQSLIRRELDRSIASERIVLAGFSQGGAVAFEAALSFGERLAGVIALSTYFPTAPDIAMQPLQRRLPVLVCHGEFDDVIPEALGRASLEDLQKLGIDPEYQTYPMAHEVCPAEIDRISQWLRTTLGD